uniref:Zinc finger protein 2-like n=1 Tax=Astyanax mexicanus TaxID=7994 RepID=A0A3B1J0H7_ASTMX
MQGSSSLQPRASGSKTQFPKTEPDSVPVHWDGVLKNDPDIRKVVFNGETVVCLKEEQEEDWPVVKIEAPEGVFDSEHRQGEGPGMADLSFLFHKGTLLIHQRVHSREKPFSCPDCSKVFATLNVLKKHLRIHSGERPYLCTVCGKGFKRVQHLTNHQRTHTGERPYACEECGTSFSQSGDLTKHMRGHTGEKPYACADCDRRFNNSGDLSKHRRSHTGYRPYRCQECSKAFLMPQHLKTHMLTHTGERPHSFPLLRHQGETDSCRWVLWE